MALASISSGMAFVAMALAVPQPEVAPTIAAHGFDLAAVTLAQGRSPASSAAVNERLPQPRIDPAKLIAPGWTPPRKTWAAATGGPVFQIGALGTSDKRIPDLAHISLDWEF